ncbi:MAG: tRNA (guanosine(37)-N1)-methyltransferase TrmD [Flavobacteriales bacterium]|nr:tRNA (guanosine(37)-N1)-methyltransferase TrmD [Bacteroidota bacterium]MCB9239542.1 tRNA (guanosine(37)-N1)-methyltransferase TrmD [Flavobacteriales bacterium]
MRLDIITVIPDFFQGPVTTSILKRASDKGLATIVVHDLRDFGLGNYKQVDDKIYGGSAGMVLMIEPILNCIESLKAQRTYDEVIYLTPDGETFNQRMANSLSLKQNLILLCGHYKGIDHRIREHVITREISIGDYVLTGGELGAAIIADAVIRLIPGVISDETSALTDSFQDGLLSAPIYTRPADYNGWTVPEVLTSGNFAEIEKWNEEQALERTQQLRPDLLDDSTLD